MKLKRCPNMHYYDEDKYAQCPHCAAAAPQPEVKPEPAPAPQPEVRPEPVPAPQPEIRPAPVPMPQPSPAPVQQPAPQPVPDGMWRCACGTVNSGRFCVECGTRRPEPEPVPVPAKPEQSAPGKWVCACGNENEGNFCFRCGAPRPVQVQQPAPEPDPEPVQQTEPEPIQQPEPEPEPAPAPDTEEDRSLTSVISEVSFTGSIEAAKEKAVKSSADDEGVTQIIFDELADELVLGWLVAANTEIKGKVFTFTDTNVTVGRSDPEHPVMIDLHGDRAVSRGAQAVIVYDPLNKKFFIRSAGGKTPVYVNRQMLLAPTELSAYDIILLGATELVFVPLCNEKFSW